MVARLAVPGGTLTVTQAGAATAVTLRTRHGTRRARLPPERRTIISAGTFEQATLLGTVNRGVVVLVTTYASQTGQGGPQARCAAGEEVVLRVLRLIPAPRQTFSLLLDSCWTAAARSPARWDAASSSFRVGNGAGDVDEAVPPYRVNADGTVTGGATPH